MAILAGALIPLLALQGQFLRTTESLERAEQRLSSESLAISHISALNLDQTPSGTLKTLYGELNWRSAAAAGPHNVRKRGGFPSRYQITLYDVTVSLTYVDGRRETFLMQSTGWKPKAPLLNSL